MPRGIKEIATPDVIFVHSLFRSGSTYIYNALKRAGKFHIYHEPMHEVIASLPSSWDELGSRKDQLKSTLRHDFLVGGYFDEFSHLLSSIKKTFDPKFGFDYYFMDAGDKASDLKAYIDLLMASASKPPVLQCTRTCGRISWLKENYKSNHIFLLRNPWDQWYSYKVDPYIATTPRIIYSQSNSPAVLKAVFEASGAFPLMGRDTQEKVVYGFKRPLDPDQDYFLFFGLWLHSFVCGERDCDIFIDMDELSASEAYRAECLAKLDGIGIKSIDFSDANLHRSVFADREQAGFRMAEEQVLEIYRQHGISVASIRKYLEEARQEAFFSTKKLDAPASGILEDAYRMRKLLVARDGQIASLSQAVTERDGQIVSLSQAVTEREDQISSLNKTVAERDAQIASLSQAVTERDSTIQSMRNSRSWRLTAPFRILSGFIKGIKPLAPDKTNKQTAAAPRAENFFTICSKNFLAHARVLYNSVREHYPNARFFVVLCDRIDDFFEPAKEPFEFVYLEELGLPDLNDMAKRYSITEFNTAVKPFAFSYLMDKHDCNSVIYLDPDLLLVDRMQELDAMLLEGAEAVLTPHILQPAEHDEVHDERCCFLESITLGF